MKSLVCIMALLILAQTSYAQYKLPPVLVDDRIPDYVQGVQLAVKQAKPLVTFLGVQPRAIDGALVCKTLYLPDYPGMCIVVAAPKGNSLYWKKTLPMNASDAEICAVVHSCKAVQPSADPFDGSFRRQSTTARPDGRDANAVGLQHHAGHNCPNCGARQTIISGQGPTRNTHTHTCARCQTIWYH